MNFSGLRDHQVPHVQHLLRVLKQNGTALDASDTGTGKTYAACALARELGVTPFVVCPKTVKASWEQTGAELGIEVEAVSYEQGRGRAGDRASAVYAASAYGAELARGKGTAWHWHEPVELCIFDEAQRCGGMSSLNSKMLIAARRQFRHILLLSATAASKPQQCKALGYALGLFPLRNFKWWVFKHGCHPGVFGGFEFTCDPDEQIAAMQKIHREIFPARGARLCKRDIPGFPRTQLSVRLIQDAAGKARRLAEEAREIYLGLRRQEKEARTELTRLLRARQALEILKVNELVELAEDYSESSKVAIFVNFSETVDALQKALAKSFGAENVGVYDGRNLDRRDEYAQSFRDDHLPVIIVNNQAGGVGIGLHGKADRTTLISPCYDANVARQLLGRVNRDGGGFSQQLFVYFANTPEADAAASLTRKFNNLDALNDADLNA